MKIIAIEGLDKSGKFSQTERLAQALALKGYTVETSEFHRYDTPTGDLIMRWLTNEWDVDQHTIELIMTADKQAQQKWFQQLEHDGVDVLILDRYISSQLAYSVASGIDIAWTNMLQKYLRQPDIEVLIDIPAEISMSRKGKHNNGENDRYESDKQLLNRVRTNYHNEFNFYVEHPIIINGEQSIETIHDQILEAVLKALI